MGRLSSALGATAMFVLVAAGVEAQAPTPPRGHRVAGFISDTTGRPLSDARVQLLAYGGTRHSVLADTLGHFVLQDVAAGRARLNVRRLGYEPYDLSIEIGAGVRPDSIRVKLAVVVLELKAVEITESNGAPEEYYQRKRGNSFGKFIDGERLVRNYGQQPSEILRGVAGIVLVPSARIGSLVRMRGCRPTLWVDGMRVAGAELDEIMSSSDIAGMEVYNSTAGLPVQYFDRGTSCGALLVWTRDR